MSAPIRILLADDHPVVRDGLAAILSTQPDFEVAGEAASGRETVSRAADLHPDVVLLDLQMPDLDGVEALRQLRADHPQTAVIVFTAFDTDERILSALKSGAAGYLLKGAPREEIFRAIRLAYQGQSLLEPLVASKLLRHIASSGQALSAGEREEPARALTAREVEVIRLLAQGLTNREIARRLVISERTAKFHVSSILRKLGAGNRTSAVAAAAQLGLVEL